MKFSELDMTRYSKVPFKEKGRSLEGWDCWGPPFVIYKEMRGIELPSFSEGYSNTKDSEEISRLVAGEKVKWFPVDKPKPFDIVLMRTRMSEMHVGVYIGNGKFIHAVREAGTVIENVESIAWRNKIVGYYRYPE